MAFPTTGILDSGVGADQNPLTTGWTCPLFTGNPSLARISNKIGATDDANDSNGWYDIETFGPDSEVHCTIDTRGANGDGLTLYARTNGQPGSVDAYAARVLFQAGTDIWRLGWYENSVGFTQLGTDTTLEVVAGWGLGLAVVGNDLQLWSRQGDDPTAWTMLFNTTHSTFAGLSGSLGVQIALSGASTAMRITDFGGGTVFIPPVDQGGSPIAWVGA